MHELYAERMENNRKERESLINTIRRLEKENIQNAYPAAFYRRMQKHILENESLQLAWRDFILIYMLIYPEEDIRELSTDDIKEFVK